MNKLALVRLGFPSGSLLHVRPMLAALRHGVKNIVVRVQLGPYENMDSPEMCCWDEVEKLLLEDTQFARLEKPTVSIGTFITRQSVIREAKERLEQVMGRLKKAGKLQVRTMERNEHER